MGTLENLEGGSSQVTVAEDVLDRIKEGLENYSQAYQIILQVRVGRTRRFSLRDGLFYYVENRLYIPKWKELRRELLNECHDSTWVRHPGKKQTLALMERGFYWLKM